MDIFNYPEHRIMDFYRKNFCKSGSEFELKFNGFDEFYSFFVGFLKKFKGQKLRLWSYNAMFDKGAFIDNALLFGIKIPKSIQKNWFCIMSLSMWKLSNSKGIMKKYTDFCIESERKHLDCSAITEKGNLKSSAEQVYRFISKDMDFIEAHKGREDTLIEGEILEWCKKTAGWNKQLTSRYDWRTINSGFKNLGSGYGSIGHIQTIIAPRDYSLKNEQTLREVLISKSLESEMC